MTYWSAATSQEELGLVRRLTKEGKVVAQLFNEACTNVAWRALECHAGSGVEQALGSGQPIAGKEGDIARDVHEVLNRLDGDDTNAVNFMNSSNWNQITSSYITNRLDVAEISFFGTDEGDQQEQLVRWLVDSLHPEGAVHSPQVSEPSGRKEFTDVLLSYDRGTFLIESKTLAIFARDALPSRDKLKRGIEKHIRDATKRQLKNACRKLQQGEAIFDKSSGTELVVERTNPAQAICLVPDLSLIRGCKEFGRDLLVWFASTTGCYLHILDTVQLFRVVQAAHILSNAGQTTTRMMAFDAHLLTRFQFAVTVDEPDFDMRLDLRSNPPRICFSN